MSATATTLGHTTSSWESCVQAEPLRVLLVDDHPLFLDGLEFLLSGAEGIEVVARAETGTAAVREAEALQPDVIVMDLNMPEMNGIDATRTIVQTSPHIAVLVLTMFDDDESVFAAMRAGARGYLLKGAAHDEIVRAVESIGTGTAVFGPTIARRVVDYFTRPRGPMAPLFPELTEREREILGLIAQGENNTAIAKQLFLSPKTIRNHVSNIFSKLQVDDRAQAIVRARREGLG
jgi:DNA-binding NarL/FixJ family response regulator